MKKKQGNVRRAALTVLDAVATITVLMLALQLIEVVHEFDDLLTLDYSAYCGVATGLFGALAAAELIRFFAQRGRTKLNDLRHLLGTALFLAAAVLLFLRRGDLFSVKFAGLSYAATLVLGRVEAVVRNHRARSVIVNVIALLLILLLLGTFVRVTFIPVFLIVLSLCHAAAVAFSQFDYKALQKVLHKTYAVEIIFGMLLLMVASSALLSSSEPGMDTFCDALWYCFAIVTTIGFGDYAATGILGRILSVILGIYGIIVVALITSVIVNFYNEVKDRPDADTPQLPAEAEETQSKEDCKI